MLRRSAQDIVTIVAAGITLHEALAAYDELKKEGILVRVIDLYSIKPVDVQTLAGAAHRRRAILTVEDHFAEGGIGEAVRSALSASPLPYHSLAVRSQSMPRSGTRGHRRKELAPGL